MDEEPSTSYTIADLDALILIMQAERWVQAVTILCGDDGEQRDRGGLITVSSTQDYPRYAAECVLAQDCRDQRTLRVLASSSFRDVRATVAENPGTPVDVLRELATSGYPSICSAATSNPALTAADLEFCAATLEYERARMGIAANPNTPQHILDQLSEDPSPFVRVQTIGRCSQPIVDRLAHDPQDMVRCHVGHSHRISIEQCELLAGDPDDWVRWAIAGNRVAPPPTVLDTLSRDTSTRVRHAVAGNLLVTSDLARRLRTDPDSDVREALAGNRSTPADVLAGLARSRSYRAIREAVATNPSCPAEVRTHLATRDRSPYVRRAAESALTRNPA
jgi:hypothetical protein